MGDLKAFEDAMLRGKKGVIETTEIDELKEALAAAVRGRIDGFTSQAAAAEFLTVSQATIHNLQRRNNDKFSPGFLLDMLFKTGAKVRIEVE